MSDKSLICNIFQILGTIANVGFLIAGCRLRSVLESAGEVESFSPPALHRPIAKGDQMPRFKFRTLATVAILAFAGFVAASAIAQAETIDFSGLANGTAVTNEYAGVVFSLVGGPDSSGPPTTNAYYGEEGLANSTNPDYPTANILNMAFTSPVSGVSFTIDNYGDNGTTFYDASNGSTANIAGDSSGFTLVSVAGSGITNLQINNGFSSDESWYFAIQQLSFTPSGSIETPEPGSFVLFGSGVLGMAGMLRRKFLGI